MLQDSSSQLKAKPQPRKNLQLSMRFKENRSYDPTELDLASP